MLQHFRRKENSERKALTSSSFFIYNNLISAYMLIAGFLFWHLNVVIRSLLCVFDGLSDQGVCPQLLLILFVPQKGLLVPHPPPGIEGILLPHYPSASIWVSLKEIIFVQNIKQNLAFFVNFVFLVSYLQVPQQVRNM